MTNESLLSIGKFCDDGCIAIFIERNIYVIKNNNLIIHGFRNNIDKLWDVNLPSPVQATSSSYPENIFNMNYIITKDKSLTQISQYYHATLFSPSISSLTKVVARGNLVTWPGIDRINFKAVLGTTIPLGKGHLDQERSHLKSTKLQIKDETEKEDKAFPDQQQHKAYSLFAMMFDTKDEKFIAKAKSYSDQTGRFPLMSSRGNQYILYCMTMIQMLSCLKP